jgi:hypothetical protein
METELSIAATLSILFFPAQEKAKQNIPILAIHIVLLYKKNTEWNYIRLLNERIQENLPKRKDSDKFQKKLVEIILP